MEIKEKISELIGNLPDAPKPVAAYVPAVMTENYVFTAGQVPFVNGKLMATGKLGADLTVEEGYDCAKVTAINCIAAINSVLDDLNRIKRIIKVTGFVNSAPGFQEQPQVLNGASELFIQIFGEKGKHARVAIGVNELPLGAPVEIDMIVEIN